MKSLLRSSVLALIVVGTIAALTPSQAQFSIPTLPSGCKPGAFCAK
jgi:hypothetical protein